MTLRFTIGAFGQIEPIQIFSAPTVYLDHWAVRRFADNAALRARFIGALQGRNGTVMLSHLTFAEFAKAELRATFETGEEFLEALLPNVYLAELDLDKAIAQEVRAGPRSHMLAPPADRQQLLMIASLRQPFGSAFTIRGLLGEVSTHRDKVLLTLQETNANIAARINNLRSDPLVVERARSYKVAQTLSRTEVILAELLRGPNLTATTSIDENDAMDLQHALISLSYCDFVLLDGKWEEWFKQMERRVAHLALPFRHARCFSDRRNGLQVFLDQLEAWP